MRYSLAMLVGFAWALATGTAPSVAGLIPTTPFTGSFQESWEGFAADGAFLPDPTTVMGGEATISYNWMRVYRPGTIDQGLGDSGSAQAVDGAQGLGCVSNLGTEIVFASPVVAFGGYWGVATQSGAPSGILFDFYDDSDALIDSGAIAYSDPAGTGALMWAGWTSDVPIKRVTFTGFGNHTATDFLQANVPEPGTIALLGMAAIGFLLVGRFYRKR